MLIPQLTAVQLQPVVTKTKKPRNQHFIHFRKVGICSKDAKIITKEEASTTIRQLSKGNRIVYRKFIPSVQSAGFAQFNMLSPTGGATFVGIVTHDKRLIVKYTVCRDNETFCKKSGRREALRSEKTRVFQSNEWLPKNDTVSETYAVHNAIYRLAASVLVMVGTPDPE